VLVELALGFLVGDAIGRSDVLPVVMGRIGGTSWTQLRPSSSQPLAVLDLHPGGTLVKQLRGLYGAFL
jgi:hypothetical protein